VPPFSAPSRTRLPKALPARCGGRPWLGLAAMRHGIGIGGSPGRLAYARHVALSTTVRRLGRKIEDGTGNFRPSSAERPPAPSCPSPPSASRRVWNNEGAVGFIGGGDCGLRTGEWGAARDSGRSEGGVTSGVRRVFTSLPIPELTPPSRVPLKSNGPPHRTSFAKSDRVDPGTGAEQREGFE